MLKIISFLKISDIEDLGQKFFYIGGFFLASALPISGLFFLLSLLISTAINKNIFQDKYNYLLFLCSGLMIFKNIQIIFSENIIFQGYKTNIWLDLLNWLLFFSLFIYSKSYLKKIGQRILLNRFIIAGSIPVLVSCILQSFFNLYGPFETLNGLIVWFQKPLEENHGGITGLFSNQNYTGLWLTAIIPLMISEFKANKRYRIFNGILITLSVYLTFLTTSKNAFLGLIVIFTLLFEFRNKRFLFITGLVGSSFIFIHILNKINIVSLEIYSKIHSIAIFQKILNFNFFTSSRFEIYKKSILLILQRPLTGWGKSLFSEKYIASGGTFNIEHTHSMPLEIAFNYGIPIAIILNFFIIILLYKSWTINNKFSTQSKEDLYNKSWFVSTLLITISHINDITYYDGKISILVWILLSGLRPIMDKTNINLKKDKIVI